MTKNLEKLAAQVTTKDDFEYRERELDDRFVAFDIYAGSIKFDAFYYLLDTWKGNVYFGDYNLPEKVMTERALLGLEIRVKP